MMPDAPLVEAVRRRPLLWIADTENAGLHQLVWHAFGYHLGLFLEGKADAITIEFQTGGSVALGCNCIPPFCAESSSQLREALTLPPTQQERPSDRYMAVGIWSGEYLYAVNALSRKLEIVSVHNGLYSGFIYEKGILTNEQPPLSSGDPSGTLLTFWPDPSIFSILDFDVHLVDKMLRTTCYLNSGLTVKIIDSRQKPGQSRSYYYENGSCEYVAALSDNSAGLHDPISIVEKHQSVQVNICFQYTIYPNTTIQTFVNNCNTKDGGSHLDGFYRGLYRAITSVIDSASGERQMLLSPTQMARGLVSVVSVWLVEPRLENATTPVLYDPLVADYVENLVLLHLERYFAVHPEVLTNLRSHLGVDIA